VTATEQAVRMARIAAAAADDKKATDIVALDVSEALVITDVFVLCSGANEPQIGAIVDEVQKRLQQAGFKAARREGERQNRWVLLDFIDIVVHVQHVEERVHYALERLWKDCPEVPLGLPVQAGA
jgi:ribosome-associated protein